MARRRRKLRSLIDKKAESQTNSSLSSKIFKGCLLLSGMIFAFYISKISTAMAWKSFLTTYRNHYHLLVHGEKDYCQPNIDPTILQYKLANKIINQEDALSSILLHLGNESKYAAFAVAGPTGVGKSLFAKEMKANFPWQENCHTFSMSDQRAEIANESWIRILPDLVDCGRNLIIIDNLDPQNVDLIQEYNQHLQNYVLENPINVVVFYLFNVITYTYEQSESYSDNIKALQKLENVNFVEFRKFNSNDLKKCIQHEAKTLNLVLSDEHFQEVFKSIDVHRSGCKNVYSKILIYGKMRNLLTNDEL